MTNPETKERDLLLAYAFRVLGARAVSATELRAKLQRRSTNGALIEDVLARVQELGYQRDSDVARIENSRAGVGTFRVRQTLKRRGLDEFLIEETLQERDPDSELADAAQLLARRHSALMRKKNPRGSAYALLARRGYPGSVIWAAIGQVEADLGQLSPNNELGHDIED